MSDQDVADSVESRFARHLAGNEKKIRDRALKKLKRYMSLRSQKTDGGFTREEMLRIWKGLFYCMWMSDKPLIQEELSKSISCIMLDFSNTKTSMLFFDVFLQTMLREWMGIDRLRMDKFYLFVRNMLEASFKFLRSKEWNVGIVDWFLSILKNGPVSPLQPYSGMHYHFCDIYLEELGKVAAGTISSDLVMRFLDPYCIFITKARNNDLVSLAVTEIFEQLIENSRPALDLLEEKEDDELVVEIRSHTQLPAHDASPVASLTVDYSVLADRIFELAVVEDVLAKSKKKAFTLVGKFRELAQGRLPLDDIPDAEYSSEDELANMEGSLVSKLVKRECDEFKTRRNKSSSGCREKLDDSGNKSEESASSQVQPTKKCKVSTIDESESPVEHMSISMKKRTKSSALKKKKRKKLIEAKLNSLENPIEDLVVEGPTNNCPTENSRMCLDNSSSGTTLVPDNMPDLVQDVTKSDIGKSIPKYQNLRKWLGTSGIKETHETKVVVDFRSSETTCVKADEYEFDKKDALPTPNKEKRAKKTSCKLQSSSIVEMPSNLPDSNKEAIIENTNSVTVKSLKCEGKGNFPSKDKSQHGTPSGKDVESIPIDSAFVNVAVSKLNKSKQKKRIAAVKRKQEPVKFHSPKRVAFEMSKTQVKPFRKTDKAMACSPSPTVIAFDPRKKPRYGLLKAVKSKKLPRSKASDFFGDA